MVVDADTLEQVVQAGNAAGQVKVLSDHSASISNIIGYLEGFALDGGRVRADLVLFESHDGFSYFSELISTLPNQIGFSISFSGIPREAADGTMLADVQNLFSVDLVLSPAANPTGVFRAQVDSAQTLMTDTKAEVVAAAIEAAPATPAAPAFNAEQAIAALSARIARIDELVGKFAAKFEAAVEEAPAAAEPAVTEAAPEVVAEVTAELSENPKIVALNNELARLKIDLEASKGTKPLEVVAPVLSRAELLKQFNEEKNPGRAAAIYKKINTLAR